MQHPPPPSDWRTTSDAARHVRRWIDSRLEEIGTGKATFATDMLNSTSWYRSIDTSGMPWSTFGQLELLFRDAQKALREERTDDAIADLQRARELVTPTRVGGAAGHG